MADRGRAGDSTPREYIDAAIGSAIVLVERQVRRATGPAYWNWYDINQSLRNAKAQLENFREADS